MDCVNGKGSTPSKNRSKQFEEYWDQQKVEAGLQQGILIEGVIRINKKNYKESYISSPDGAMDILIDGLLNRNRALNGDMVVCLILEDTVITSPKKNSLMVGVPASKVAICDTTCHRPKLSDGAGVETMKSKKVEKKDGIDGNKLSSQPSSQTQKVPTSESCISQLMNQSVELSETGKLEETENEKEKVIKKRQRRARKNFGKFDEPVEQKKLLGEGAVTVNGQDANALHTQKIRPRKKTKSGTKASVGDSVSVATIYQRPESLLDIEMDIANGQPKTEQVSTAASTDASKTIETSSSKKKRTKKPKSKSNPQSDVQQDEKLSTEDQPSPQISKESMEDDKANQVVPECRERVPENLTKINVGEMALSAKKKRDSNWRNKPKVKNVGDLLSQQNQHVGTEAASADGNGQCLEKYMSAMTIGQVPVMNPCGQQNDSDVQLAASSSSVVRKTAKVVFIRENVHSRRAIGHVRPWPYSQNSRELKYALFVPKDHRVPRMKIPHNEELEQCFSQPNMLYLAQIDSWEEINHPIATLSCSIGNSGSVESETIGLLMENDVEYSDFPDEVLTNLPELPWTIPADEVAKRRDFRNEFTCTIDPSDARDLDDALSARFLRFDQDGLRKLYKVSVHIADVSFFVNEQTVLDEIASQRSTSTYLVDRVIPMLPSVLCEHICSLKSGEDRLAFSVEWTMNEKGDIIDEWFGRSVIKSCANLSYEVAQAIIERQDRVNFPTIYNKFNADDVCQAIDILQAIAINLREKREKQGALRLDLPRLSFKMDWETRTPTGFRVYDRKDSHKLVEEFMLLANMRVAMKIYENFPQISVLRNHPPPDATKRNFLSKELEALGIHMDLSSSASIQQGMLQYAQASSDPVSVGRNLVISNLIAKPMKNASYICSGSVKCEEGYRHFALSTGFYTHFTSPIRRYPDILVHRLLGAALEEEGLHHWHTKAVSEKLSHCNKRKLAAKTVQELHSELHLAALLRQSGSVEVKGVVLHVHDHSVDVVFFYLGIVRRVYLEKLPLDQLIYERKNGVGKLTLSWKGEGSVPVIQYISVFSLLDIVLSPNANGELQFESILQKPTSTN